MEVRKMYVGSQASVVERARTFQEMESDLRKASQKITPKIYASFFRERVNGRAFKRRYNIKE